MTVLRRKLFNRGGPVSSRGVGITSGFTTPVRGYKFGGSALNQEKLTADAKIPETGLSEKIQSNMDMLRSTGLFPERKPFDTKEALAPYLLDVSARLLANKSKQGGIGGALDIAGQSLAGSTPLLSQALKEKRAYESTDPDAQMKQLALQLALKDDPEASITVEKITTVMKDGKAVQMLTYFKDGVYTEKVIGDAQPSEDSAVKGIPRDLFDTLSEKQQQEILIPSGDTTVKGIPRDIFDGLDTEDRNAVLGIVDNPDITSANIIEVTEGGKKVKKLTYFENGKYQEQVIGDVADDPIEIKGVPQSIYNDLNDDQKERLLGIDEAPQVIKGIPKDLFDGLSKKNQNIILGLGGDGIQNINIVEVLDTDGETPVKKLTYTQDGVFQQIDLGKAVPAEDGTTEAERAIESLKDLTNEKKSDYADILSQYGPLPSGDGSDIFTEADVNKIYQTAKNNLAKIKTTEQSNVISPADAAAMTLNEEIIKKVVTPKMEKIEQTSNTAVKTLSIANGAVKTTSNSVITLNNNSEDGDSGYTLEDDDKVVITLQQGAETSFMYPASSLIGMEATATGQTTLRFKSLKNDGTDDVVAINHDNAKYQDIVNGINAIVNGNKHGGVVTVIDGHGGETRLSKELAGLGIDGLIYTPEASY